MRIKAYHKCSMPRFAPLLMVTMNNWGIVTMKNLFTLGLLIFCLPISAEAVTISNSISIYNGGAGDPRCGTTSSALEQGSGNIEASLNDGGLNCTVAGEAYAAGGVVGYRSTATFDRLIGPPGRAKVQGGASSAMSNIFLTPLFDLDDPRYLSGDFQIDLQLNASLEGTVTAAVAYNKGQASGGGSITATAKLSGVRSPGSFSTQSAVARGGAGAAAFGPLADFDDFSTLLMPVIRHDWRQPFSVTFMMSTDVVATATKANQATATLDAFNSLSFSKTGPAFILPDGFTVHAPELNIFDNRWVDPRVTDPSPIPLPAGLPLLVCGLGLLGLMGQRKAH